jgi:thioredoxin reductase (NADPH)
VGLRHEFVFMREVVGLRADGPERIVSLSDGSSVRGRAVIIATGVDYRRLDVAELEAMIGRGVYYGAAVTEASP